ncbi:MAG: hypothetical protein LBH93_02965, partial [Chitinispirillales bacterium]|nr:hypothetical protein [Chitinispirillales bacterium]
MRKRAESFFCVMVIALAVNAQNGDNIVGVVDTVNIADAIYAPENNDTASIRRDDGDSVNTGNKNAAAIIPPISADSSASVDKPNIKPDTAEPKL